jgi:hypothetical protein
VSSGIKAEDTALPSPAGASGAPVQTMAQLNGTIGHSSRSLRDNGPGTAEFEGTSPVLSSPTSVPRVFDDVP